MKQIFDDLSLITSKNSTQLYSTSFSMGIRLLSPKIRDAVYSIYAYVRLADEIVDSFHDYRKDVLLHKLIHETDEALEQKISLNPILNAFQKTVHEYDIDLNLIKRFLKSMELDLHKIDYNTSLYKEYILGSAEVVGLMCLQIFVDGDKNSFQILKPFAMKLGSAFQKVNFLRDVKNDFEILGRSYFPNIDILNFDNISKQQIENDIEVEFKIALKGIKMLPKSSKFGVYLAYCYYYKLFKKIKKTPVENILKERIRISNTKKIMIGINSFICYKFQII